MRFSDIREIAREQPASVAGVFQITALACSELLAVGKQKNNPSVRLQLLSASGDKLGRSFSTTPKRLAGSAASWADELFALAHTGGTAGQPPQLAVSVWHCSPTDASKQEKMIGTAAHAVPLTYKPFAPQGPHVVQLRNKAGYKNSGTVAFSVAFVPRGLEHARTPGRVVVTAVRARGLKQKSRLVKDDPYLRVRGGFSLSTNHGAKAGAADADAVASLMQTMAHRRRDADALARCCAALARLAARGPDGAAHAARAIPRVVTVLREHGGHSEAAARNACRVLAQCAARHADHAAAAARAGALGAIAGLRRWTTYNAGRGGEPSAHVAHQAMHAVSVIAAGRAGIACDRDRAQRAYRGALADACALAVDTLRTFGEFDEGVALHACAAVANLTFNDPEAADAVRARGGYELVAAALRRYR